MRSSLRNAIHLWESCQVELQGRYSVERLVALARYEQETTTIKAFTVVVLTPVVCTVVLILADVPPLQSAYAGLQDQGWAYWVRTQYSGIVFAFTTLVQFSHSATGLHLPWKTLAIPAFSIATLTTATFLGLHTLIGFPTPFLYPLDATPWQATLAIVCWRLWGSKLRTDGEARRNFLRYAVFWLSQVSMILMYQIMIYVYRLLDGEYQTLFSMSLPLVKLAVKNAAHFGVYRVEQHASICIVFSVDVFHALFVMCAMQSSTTQGTLWVVVAMDVFQSIVAVVEVNEGRRRLQKIQEKMNDSSHQDRMVDLKMVKHTWTRVVPSKPRSQDCTNIATNPLVRSVSIVTASETIRKHPELALPRHLRGIRTKHALRLHSARVLATSKQSTVKPLVTSSPIMKVAISQAHALDAVDEVKMCYVQETTQLLYMVEFYLLTELSEVIVAVVYSIYLAAMRHLPNRSHYAHLKAMTDEEYLAIVVYIAKYAVYEVFSLLVLALVLRRMVGISPLHHLAFTLETNWMLAQSMLTEWVFFPIQLSLDHLGNDYSMQFAWLRKTSMT